MRCGDAAGRHVAAGAEHEALRSQHVKQPRRQSEALVWFVVGGEGLFAQ